MTSPHRIVIVDSPAIAGRGATLFPGSVVLYANGVLPADAFGYQDAVVASVERPRIDAFCPAFIAAGCPSVREWETDLKDVTERSQIEELAKQGALKPYIPPSAPQVNPTEPPPPPAAVAEPAGAEPVRSEPEGYYSNEAPPFHPDIPEGAESSVRPFKKPRRPRLASVDGNLARAPEAAAEESPVAFSESAFASHFVNMHGDNWRCVRQWGKWFNWDGEAWCEDRTDCRMEPMKALFDDAQNWPNALALQESTRRALFGRANPMWSALKLAGTDRKIRAEPEIWDADPWMIGVPGGVVDLKTGKLLDAARDQHITMRCAVRPQRGDPTTWLRSLEQWTGGDADIIGFLRRYLGYALTGDAREQCMAFFYGPAQAGKGTVLRTISGIMGTANDGSGGKFKSYHYEAPISTFMESRGDRHTTELAAFYKKRLITSEEPNAGAKWDEGKLKWITGGSQITARYIAQDNFSFTMTGKIIVAANHRPRLSTTDKAIRRRMMVIPFEHPVADEKRDNGLDGKLRDEWPQILNWLIEGCLEWQDCGLGLPERIAHSTDQYLESEDTLGAWLEENCERNRDTDGAVLYRDYANWCERNGDNSWTRRAWSNALIERGFTTRKGTAGMRLVCALNLKHSPA